MPLHAGRSVCGQGCETRRPSHAQPARCCRAPRTRRGIHLARTASACQGAPTRSARCGPRANWQKGRAMPLRGLQGKRAVPARPARAHGAGGRQHGHGARCRGVSRDRGLPPALPKPCARRGWGTPPSRAVMALFKKKVAEKDMTRPEIAQRPAKAAGRAPPSGARMGTPYLTNMREMLDEGTATYL